VIVTKKIYLYSLISILFSFCFGVVTAGDLPVPIKNEIVMPPLSKIEANTSNGKITIEAGKGLTRYYTWNDETRHVTMVARDERWLGSLGLYYPGTGFHWKATSDGIRRGVLEEGKQHFKTKELALEWIKKQVYWGAVYRDDGLLVQYNKEGCTLSVGVWQIYVDGKKPKQLSGSKNKFIFSSWQKNKGKI